MSSWNPFPPPPAAPPPPVLHALEFGRAPWELVASLAAWPLLQTAPRGDGHPVLVLPGLVSTDLSTLLLRLYLASLGHAVRGWGLGHNLGPRREIVDVLHNLLEALYARHGRRLSLVGWSLGGVYARLLARDRPELVRCVVTLGTPIAGSGGRANGSGNGNGSSSNGNGSGGNGNGTLGASTHIDYLYRWLSGEPKVDARTAQEARPTPPVPVTSIFSRSDGIVSWRSSVQPDGPSSENIEVVGSHMGLGAHPAVLYAVADRLAQPENDWQPFDRGSWRSLLYLDPARP